MPASERQHALAAAHAEDKAALGKHNGDRSGFRVQWCAYARQPKDSQQGNQSNM
jgi:hypothetical protein